MGPDMYLDMSINQGYVPKTCTQKGGYVWGAVNVGHDPCLICRHDRGTCKGRQPRPDDADKGVE